MKFQVGDLIREKNADLSEGHIAQIIEIKDDNYFYTIVHGPDQIGDTFNHEIYKTDKYCRKLTKLEKALL